VGNTNKNPVNIRLVTKTSVIRNFSENIRSDVKTSEVATLIATTDTPALITFCNAVTKICQTLWR